MNLSGLNKTEIGGAMVIGSVLLIIGGFWWWAIFGMADDVGTALGVTAGVLLLAGFAAAMSEAER